jgi:hypothetical protein
VGTAAARLAVTYPYAQTSAVMRVLERAGAARQTHGFAAGGEAGVVEFSVAAGGVAELTEQLREASGGALSPTLLGEEVLYRNADD